MRSDGVFGDEDAGKWKCWNIGSMIKVMGEFRETGGWSIWRITRLGDESIKIQEVW